MCTDKAVADGLCVPEIGCDKITTGQADKDLCVALLNCMVNTHCAINDPFDCFCGTSAGTACLTNPVGACVSQVMAATKAASATDAGTRFYDTAFPSGNATQDVSCRKDFCGPAGDPPNACPL